MAVLFVFKFRQTWSDEICDNFMFVNYENNWFYLFRFFYETIDYNELVFGDKWNNFSLK